MPFLNLNTFSALFIVSGMAFQRMLPRKAREFMPKDIVLVDNDLFPLLLMFIFQWQPC